MNFKVKAAASFILLLFLASNGAVAVDADITGGKFGNALWFDGVDDHVSVPDSPSLRVQDELTVEAWVFFERGSTGTQLIVRKWLDSDGGWASYVLGKLSDGRIYGSVMNKAQSQDPAWYTNQTVAQMGIEGTWAHVAFAWKKDALTSADGKIFINGISVPTTFDPRSYSSSFTIGYGDYPLYFASKTLAAWQSSYFEGRLDEIRISNISRVSFNLAAPPTADAHTVGLWHFDEGTGTLVSDSSSRANHGAVSGAAWAGLGNEALSINGKIAFQSDRDGDWEIFVMNPDGSGETQLTNNTYGDECPRWSPDGSKILFCSNRDGNWQVYVMNSDGTGQTRVSNNIHDDWQACWSPDGARIAFASDRAGNAEIYVMNANGTGQTRLTFNSYYDGRPVWSPDGARILWESDRGAHWDIYVMYANGTGETRLTALNEYDGEPSWSPDGSKIAFCGGRGGNYDIYVMNADGSNQTRLTFNSATEEEPFWSPDGTRIVFESDRDGNWEIYLMASDGSSQTRLTLTDADEYWPAWQTLYITGFQQSGVGSDFAGNVLSVGGTAYTAGQLPVSFAWEAGTTHSFSWSSPLVVNEGKRYVWSSASGLATNKSGTLSAPSANGSVTADYDTQYYLTFLAAAGGSVDKASGWYAASSNLTITPTPDANYALTGWSMTGSISVIGYVNQSVVIRVDGAGTVSPVFEGVDLVPPTITVISPANGSATTNTTVTISASFADDVAIDQSSAVLRADGANVTPSATVTTTGITWSSSFAVGSHSIELTVQDTSGNARTATWSFTVQEPPKSGCFIATATYGSEAAPQVQALRDFRDGIAMKTFAGSSFMQGFLTWYYSWSPPVADTIAPDSNAKAVMRVALQPLLNILDVATSVNSALSFNAEFAITTAGFAAASLIGLVYLLPLTTLTLIGAKSYRRNLALPSAFTVLRFTAVPWVVSVALIAAAEIALSPALMMAATAAFVICTMLLTVGTISIWLASLYRRG